MWGLTPPLAGTGGGRVGNARMVGAAGMVGNAGIVGAPGMVENAGTVGAAVEVLATATTVDEGRGFGRGGTRADGVWGVAAECRGLGPRLRGAPGGWAVLLLPPGGAAPVVGLGVRGTVTAGRRAVAARVCCCWLNGPMGGQRDSWVYGAAETGVRVSWGTVPASVC